MPNKKVFVTVGTTEFDELIKTVSSAQIQKKLLHLGYNSLQLQTGKIWETTSKSSDLLQLNYAKYFDDFQSEIKSSDLVISHAGAGSCLEVLRLNKPLVVVVNEQLMDNHQIELADQLQNDGYLFWCYCSNLEETLSKNFGALKTYPVASKELFGQYLDSTMGFVK